MRCPARTRWDAEKWKRSCPDWQAVPGEICSTIAPPDSGPRAAVGWGRGPEERCNCGVWQAGGASRVPARAAGAPPKPKYRLVGGGGRAGGRSVPELPDSSWPALACVIGPPKFPPPGLPVSRRPGPSRSAAAQGACCVEDGASEQTERACQTPQGRRRQTEAAAAATRPPSTPEAEGGGRRTRARLSRKCLASGLGAVKNTFRRTLSGGQETLSCYGVPIDGYACDEATPVGRLLSGKSMVSGQAGAAIRSTEYDRVPSRAQTARREDGPSPVPLRRQASPERDGEAGSPSHGRHALVRHGRLHLTCQRALGAG